VAVKESELVSLDKKKTQNMGVESSGVSLMTTTAKATGGQYSGEKTDLAERVGVSACFGVESERQG